MSAVARAAPQPAPARAAGPALPRAVGVRPVQRAPWGRPDGVAPDDGYKRAFDLAGLCVAGVLLAPLWVVLAVVVPLAVRAQDGGPVLYRQRRLGRDGAVFEMLKFRTMAVGAERSSGPVWAVPGDGRATPVGRWLRRLRLDELPQAWNVLRGEMSLVGPRPERPALAARCEREAPGFARRLALRPGIAGLAQARGGSTVGLRHKLRYDLLYLRALGPWLDLKLCAASVLRAGREALRPPRPPRPRSPNGCGGSENA